MTAVEAEAAPHNLDVYDDLMTTAVAEYSGAPSGRCTLRDESLTQDYNERRQWAQGRQ